MLRCCVISLLERRWNSDSFLYPHSFEEDAKLKNEINTATGSLPLFYCILNTWPSVPCYWEFYPPVRLPLSPLCLCLPTLSGFSLQSHSRLARSTLVITLSPCISMNEFIFTLPTLPNSTPRISSLRQPKIPRFIRCTPPPIKSRFPHKPWVLDGGIHTQTHTTSTSAFYLHPRQFDRIERHSLTRPLELAIPRFNRRGQSHPFTFTSTVTHLLRIPGRPTG